MVGDHGENFDRGAPADAAQLSGVGSPETGAPQDDLSAALRDDFSAALRDDLAAALPDEAVEAIVYDVHPALAAPLRPRGFEDAADDNPYAPRRPLVEDEEAEPPLPRMAQQLGAGLAGLSQAWTRPADYQVPKRFGMSAILGITTALAVLFGIMKWMNSWPVFYLFFGVQVLAICFAQMLSGRTPRLASVIAGAIILPTFALVAASFDRRNDPAGWLCAVVLFVPFGALLGYLTGACAAGVFLLMDLSEQFWAKRAARRGSAPLQLAFPAGTPAAPRSSGSAESRAARLRRPLPAASPAAGSSAELNIRESSRNKRSADER